HPNADIRAESFADTRDAEATYDLAIGNVPFGKAVLRDKSYNSGGHAIHNHFIVKSLHLVRPGGLVVLLTSRYTMDARNPAARREIAGLADLVAAVRLPSGAHQRAAGTGVVTDLLVLRRREPGRDQAGAAWEQARVAEFDGVEVPVSQYFLDHPEHVLGELATAHSVYRADDLVVRPVSGAAAADGLAAALSKTLDGVAASACNAGLT